MKPRSNDSGVSQRRIPWFAIAIALTVAVSGFGRFAAAQQPAPRAQSGNDAPSRKRDLIDDEKLFPDEPKIAPYVFTYPNVKGLDPDLFSTTYAEDLVNKYAQAGSKLSTIYTEDLVNKYAEAGSKLSGLLTKYQDFTWDYKFNPLFTQTPGALGASGGVGSGAGAGLGYGVRAGSGSSQSADDDPYEFKI